MTNFSFVATKKDGSTLSSTIESSDRAAAIRSIQAQGLKLVNLKETDAKSGRKRRRKIKSDELVMFTRQLSSMVSAGVPILRSLESMTEHAESASFRSIIGDVSKDIESGLSFADALARHPDTFNDVYVNMVRAGETGGILDDILKRLALQQVLIVITIGAFFGLMIFVLPMIGKTIKDLAGEDAELPALTQAMLGISAFMVNFWYILLPLVGAAIYGFLRYIKTPGGKKKYHHFLVHGPIIGKIMKKIAIARFTRTFSSLIGAGVAVLEALEVTSKAVGNNVYEESLNSAAKRVKNGEVFSKIIAEDEVLYPPIVAQMLAVGEETGQTDQVLVKVADFYEEEVDTAIASISSTIEPVMIVFMGGMVGLIAASVMMPITGLANQIKG